MPRLIVEKGHEIQLVEHLIVLLHIGVALGGTLVVIECGAGRNHVNDCQTLVDNRGLQNGLKLPFVAGE